MKATTGLLAVCAVAALLLCSGLTSQASAQTVGVYFVTGTIADYGYGNGQHSRFFIENTFDWLWPTKAGSGAILLIWDNNAWNNAWKTEMNSRGITWTERTGGSLTAGDLNSATYRIVLIAEYRNSAYLGNMGTLVTAMENYVNTAGVIVDMIGSNYTRRWSTGTPGPFGVQTQNINDSYNYVAAVGHDMVANMGTPYFTGSSASHARIPTIPTGSTTLLTAGSTPGGTSVANYLEIQVAPEISSPTPGSLGTLTEGQTNYSETFECQAGTPPYDWSLTGAPGWLSFNPTAGVSVELVASTVGAAGSYTFDVTVTDSTGATDTETYDIDVNPPPVITGPAALDGVTETGNWPAPYPFTASGGFGGYTWSVTGAPPGMAINSGTGSLNGPVSAGATGASPYNLTIVVEDGNGVQDTYGPLSLNVNAPPIITSSLLPLAPLTVPYSTFLQATNGTQPYTWSISGNTGPFSVDPGTGEITGTAMVVASYTFDAMLTDASGVTAQGSITIDTGEPPEITPPTIPELTLTGPVPPDVLIEATGGFPASYSWSYLGTLPAGLTLTEVTLVGGDVAYQLGGTPQFGTTGSHDVDVTVEDTFQSLSDTVTVTIVIKPIPAIDLTAGSELPPATITGTYSAPFAVVTGTGAAPFTWAFDNVAGPTTDLDGFAFVDQALTSANVIGPAGQYTFDATVTDKNGVTATESFTILINPAPAFPEVPYAQVGKLYTADFGVQEGTGTGPFTYTIITNLAVLTGLTIMLDGQGVPTVTGTPPSGSEGSYTFQLNVVDANGVSVTQSLTLIINKKPSSGCCGVSTATTPGAWWLLMVLLPVAWAHRRRPQA